MPNEKVRLLVESLSTRFTRVQSVLLILGKRERQIAGVQRIIKKMRDELGVPVRTMLATRLPEPGTLRYADIVDSCDLVIGFKVEETEASAACLLLDAKNSGAYVVLVDNDVNSFRSNVNIQLKTKLPGMVEYIINQASRRKNGTLVKKGTP